MIYRNYVKRGIDFLGSVVLLVGLSWLLLIIGLVYLLTWNFPILFKQKRAGKACVIFHMWKFRTLTSENKPLQERRFLVGDLLRATSFDELPQLFNVLKGDMSLIGPRPLPEEYVPLMKNEYRVRERVRPGITGWTQVNGRHDLPWERKFDLDIYYVENLSFWLDLKIAMKTLFVLLSFKKDISLEEKPFTG